MSRDTVLVYVGANQGNSLSELYTKFDRVYAFEPDPETFECLKLNNPKNVDNLYMSALSNKVGN